MFTRINILNYRSLRSIDVSLRPLTVLVGPNDTGKSSFLAAIHGMAHSTWEESDVWRLGSDATRIIATLESGKKIVWSRQEAYQGSDEGALQKARKLIPIVQLPSRGPAMHAAGVSDQGVCPSLTADGSNVPAVVDYLLRRDRAKFNLLESAMIKHVA